jgi:periplasmic divalent cation tolerance protein
METVRVVFVSIPREEAEAMARGLVQNRLAACINIAPRIESYFWWDNKVQYDLEALLIIKTTTDKFDDMVKYVQEHHPYELPEIIAVSLSEALPAYVDWVKSETNR